LMPIAAKEKLSFLFSKFFPSFFLYCCPYYRKIKKINQYSFPLGEGSGLNI